MPFESREPLKALFWRRGSTVVPISVFVLMPSVSILYPAQYEPYVMVPIFFVAQVKLNVYSQAEFEKKSFVGVFPTIARYIDS